MVTGTRKRVAMIKRPIINVALRIAHIAQPRDTIHATMGILVVAQGMLHIV